MEKNTPEKKYSAGAISATVWKNNGTSKNGDAVEFRTVSIQRSYQDKNGTWQATNSLRTNDLPKAALVLNKAYEFVMLRSPSQDSLDSDEVEVEEVR